MYNTNGLIQLTTFQLAVIFGAITTFAAGVLLYTWKEQGDSFLGTVNNGEDDVSNNCENIINKNYHI